MKRRTRLAVLACAAGVALASGCAPSIPQEPVPAGWALDVHQPGEWWTQPLIPRSVVVQRCPPRPAWASEPDLSAVTGLPPGSSVEYSFGVDDYHCSIGWSEPATELQFTAADTTDEAGLRRVCSSTGLPMDDSWRLVAPKPSEAVGELPGVEEMGRDATTVAFIDDEGTVASCLLEFWGDADSGLVMELSVGADSVAALGGTCPVQPSHLARNDDGTLAEYQLRGAGAVRDASGRILTDAATVQLRVEGDTVTTTHPVVDGIAIVDAWVKPDASVSLDWDRPPKVEGQVFGADGNLLGSCRS